jgi:threonine dehydratase
VQIDSCAPYANLAVAAGAITTLADGIAVKAPGLLTRPLVEAWVDDIVTVGEDEVADAMMLLMERAKLFVEGGGSVGVAALMAERVAPARAGVTVVVLSGGNVDLGVLPNLIRRAETLAGRRLILFVRITDRPGGLARLLNVISESRANVIEVEHVREGVDLHVRETGVQIAMEVRNREHADRIVAAVRSAGYHVSEPTPR